MMKYKNPQKNKRKYAFLATSGLALLVLLFFTYTLIESRDSQKKSDNQTQDQTTSELPSAQSDFTSDSDREVAESTDKGQAIITDNSGEIANVPDESQWSRSTNNEIVLYSPAAQTKITSGQIVSGTSTLPTVNFRVIDSVSGVIAQGELVVVDGKFSGNINFNTAAAEGRLDLYATKEDGAEYANIEIPISF